MCNFPTIKDAADVAIATMLSGIQAKFLKFHICFSLYSLWEISSYYSVLFANRQSHFYLFNFEYISLAILGE